MNKLTIIRQGESLPFEFDRDGADINGWTCTISWKEKPGDAAIASRVVPASNGTWPGFLTQSETSGLPVLPKGAAYYLIAKLENTGTDEEEIITVRFKVSTAWA
jgi:hypothetical protein